ncbi:MAG TPA: hypothetical protein VJ161_10095 [Geobacteraceae bacterium]|nr:hypothetical protein [Geobacteraceae bacterium]
MKANSIYAAMASVLLFVVLLFPIGSTAAETVSPLIGQPVTNFSLSSTQDRLVNYGPDYYGKYNLIITFFPAAFTPV